jgi:hypothetical protein
MTCFHATVGSKFLVLGIRSTSIHTEVKNCIEDILHKTSKNLRNNQVFNAMKLLETYLPDIMKSVHEKLKKTGTMDWTENECRKLKMAMDFFPQQEFMREPEDRWRRVAGFVNTKTIDQ